MLVKSTVSSNQQENLAKLNQVVANGDFVTFVGSGISPYIHNENGSKAIPSWLDVFLFAARTSNNKNLEPFVSNLLKSGDIETAMNIVRQDISRNGGDVKWHEFLSSQFIQQSKDLDSNSKLLLTNLGHLCNYIVNFNYGSNLGLGYSLYDLSNCQDVAFEKKGFQQVFGSNTQLSVTSRKLMSWLADKNSLFIGCSVFEAHMLKILFTDYSQIFERSSEQCIVVFEKDFDAVSRLLADFNVCLVMVSDVEELVSLLKLNRKSNKTTGDFDQYAKEVVFDILPRVTEPVSDVDNVLAVEVPLDSDVQTIKESLDDASDKCRNLFIIFLAVEFYLAFIVWNTSDLDLFLANTHIDSPFLNIKVPLIGFFFLAPVLFVGFLF